MRNIKSGQSMTLPCLILSLLVTNTKSTCGCKDDKDECDTEKNPIWDRAALQCFQQIIWFTLEKFNLSFDHFESFGSGSTSFLWKFSLTAFPSRSGSSVGSWSIPCIKFQGSPLPFFKDNWQIVEDCTKLNFLCQNGIQVSKGLTFTSFLGTQLSCQLIPLSLSYSSYRRFNFPCFSGTTGRQNRL